MSSTEAHLSIKNPANKPGKPGPEAQIQTARMAITVTYYITFLALGMTVASFGPALFRLAEHTGTEVSQISILFPARSFGFVAGSLLGGFLYDRVRGNPVLGIMIVLMAAGLVVIPVVSMLWLLVMVVLLVGLVDGFIDVGGNTLLLWLHREKVGPFMNALHFFFGVGASLSPLIIARSLAGTADITWGYWALALLTLPVSIHLFRLPSPSAPKAEPNQPIRPADTSLVWLLVIFFFLFVAVEMSYGGWIAAYAVGKGLADEANAAYLTFAFWGALTAGRLITIPIALRFSIKRILWWNLVGCVVSLLVILLWPDSLVATWIGSLGMGVAMASMFPLTISLAEQAMTMTGRITGRFLVGGAMGGMVVPWLAGQLFEAVGPSMVMWSILVVLLLALGLFGLLMQRMQQLIAVR